MHFQGGIVLIQAAQKTNNNPPFTLWEMILCAMMTAVMVICSWITIPAEVPFTLQTFAVFCTIILLGGRCGFFTLLTYIMLGAAGVPVFSGMKGGIGVLFGATGGYILGFFFIALIYWGTQKLLGDHIITNTAAMILGLLVCYAFGTVWFIHVYTKGISVYKALKLCVIPFIIPDLAKLAFAYLLTFKVKKQLNTATR